MKSRLFNLVKRDNFPELVATGGLAAGSVWLASDTMRGMAYHKDMERQGYQLEKRNCQPAYPQVLVNGYPLGYEHPYRCSMWVKKSAEQTEQVPYDTSYKPYKA